MEEPKKVFFITSNQSKLNNFMEYQVPRNKGLINLKAGISNCELKEDQKFKNSTFTVFVNSLEINPKELRKEEQDPKTKKYLASINLKYNRANFQGNFSFRSTKNNFLYDFRFNEYRGWGKIYDPPPQINFSQLDQLKFISNI